MQDGAFLWINAGWCWIFFSRLANLARFANENHPVKQLSGFIYKIRFHFLWLKLRYSLLSLKVSMAVSKLAFFKVLHILNHKQNQLISRNKKFPVFRKKRFPKPSDSNRRKHQKRFKNDQNNQNRFHLFQVVKYRYKYKNIKNGANTMVSGVSGVSSV